MSTVLPIGELPAAIDFSEAVGTAYGPELQQTAEKLAQGLSVLIECEKQVVPYFYSLLRKRMPDGGAKFVCIDGCLPRQSAKGKEEAQEMVPPTRIGRMIRALDRAVRESVKGDEIIVIPALDLLTATTGSGLTDAAREVVSILYENPMAVFLGFRDPSFELPPVLTNLFPIRLTMVGIPRDRLDRLVTRHEARKFHHERFNPFQLYKYVSGLNPVRLRQILGQFHSRSDYDPANPLTAEQITRDLRAMTVSGQFELPNLDLDRDLGGYHRVKERIRQDVLDLVRRRDELTAEGEIRELEKLIPRGIIFWGPPGTGKTCFAKAIATALDATVTVVSGPEIKSMWVGETEANLRRIFAAARRNAPSVIIFDELDSIAAARGTYTGSGVEHSLVNQLLTEMDGFRQEELVLVVGTTNFVSSLDPALLRPGRFELQLHVPWPEGPDRREIVQLYREKLGLKMDDAAVEHAVKRTDGRPPGAGGGRYTGDHLYALLREVRREELRRGGPLAVTIEEIDHAMGRLQPARPPVTEQERHVIAIHEAGHAILETVVTGARGVDRVMLARPELDADAVGATVSRARERRYVLTRRELLAEVCSLLGGRIAERLLIGEESCGSGGDLRAAYGIARLLVEELGMVTGEFPLVHDRPGAGPVLISERSRGAIDDAVRAVVAEQEKVAEREIRRHRNAIVAIVEKLVAASELSGAELRELMAAHPPLEG